VPRSDQFDHGYVVGILVSSRMDSDDPDRIPDAVPATNIKPEFQRVVGQYRVPLHEPDAGSYGMLVSSERITTAVMPSGHITSDLDTAGNAKQDAQPGLWLPVGVYRVSFGGHFSPFEIEVTKDHTEASPLDLYTVAPVSAGPGTPINVLPVPVDPAPGEFLAWGDGGLVWLPVDEAGQGPEGPEGPEGPPGEDGLSAYEVAVAEGFEGSPAEWLASLEGPPGEDGAPGIDGLSAYEIAVDEGFEGSVEDWLDSLVGPEGPEGPPGADGEQGPPGEKGEQGPPGADGADGQDGAPGDKGDKGDKGDPGEPGQDAGSDLETIAAGVTVTVRYDDGWPTRPTNRTGITVQWVAGTTAPPEALPGDIWIPELA